MDILKKAKQIAKANKAKQAKESRSRRWIAEAERQRAVLVTLAESRIHGKLVKELNGSSGFTFNIYAGAVNKDGNILGFVKVYKDQWRAERYVDPSDMTESYVCGVTIRFEEFRCDPRLDPPDCFHRHITTPDDVDAAVAEFCEKLAARLANYL